MPPLPQSASICGKAVFVTPESAFGIAIEHAIEGINRWPDLKRALQLPSTLPIPSKRPRCFPGVNDVGETVWRAFKSGYLNKVLTSRYASVTCTLRNAREGKMIFNGGGGGGFGGGRRNSVFRCVHFELVPPKSRSPRKGKTLVIAVDQPETFDLKRPFPSREHEIKWLSRPAGTLFSIVSFVVASKNILNTHGAASGFPISEEFDMDSFVFGAVSARQPTYSTHLISQLYIEADTAQEAIEVRTWLERTFV